MSRAFDNQNTGHGMLFAGTPYTTAYPLTFACWFRTKELTRQQTLIMIGPSASSDNRFSMQISSTGFLLNEARTTSSALATCATSCRPNTWHHACATFTNATTRAIYLDGSNKATNATSRTPTGTLNRISIGFDYNISSRILTGDLTMAAIWNVALSDTEVWRLAGRGQGMQQASDPRTVQRSALVDLWPADAFTSIERDVVGGLDMQVVGNRGDVPPVFATPRRRTYFSEAAAAATAFPWIYYAQQRR